MSSKLPYSIQLSFSITKNQNQPPKTSGEVLVFGFCLGVSQTSTSCLESGEMLSILLRVPPARNFVGMIVTRFCPGNQIAARSV